MSAEMKTCPWCGRTAKLVMVMLVTKSYTESAKVCTECKKKWVKKLRQKVEGGGRRNG